MEHDDEAGVSHTSDKGKGEDEKASSSSPRAVLASAVDWEERHRAAVQTVPADDPARACVAGVQGDVTVTTVQRQHRTLSSTIPQHVLANFSQFPRHVREIVSVIGQDWKVVKRAYSNHLAPPPLPDLTKKIPYEAYTTDGKLPPEYVRQPALPTTPLFGPYDGEVERITTHSRASAALDLFKVFHIPAQELDNLNPRSCAPPMEPTAPERVFFEARMLEFDIGELEPFFCTATLFDRKRQCRISETFAFDVNTPKTMQLIHRMDAHDISTLSKRAIFSLPSRSTSVFMVVQVNKVLSGVPLDSALDAYIKFRTMKAKERTRFETSAGDNCLRMRDFLQPFAATVVPLFNDDGALAPDCSKPFLLYGMKGNWLQDDHILDRLIPALCGDDKKLRQIPGQLFLDFRMLSHGATMPGCLQPSLIPTHPAGDGQSFIKEIQAFPAPGTIAAPDYHYVHHLYVYPESANMQKCSGKASGRNLMLEVLLKELDGGPGEAGLPAIYGPSSGPKMLSAATTRVIYHNKKPMFGDEFKLVLPPVLTPKHHLLFTFYHIVCKPPKKGKPADQLRVPIAYAWLPLLTEDNRVLPDASHERPATTVLPPNYFSAEAEEAMKWVDKRPVFRVRTKLMSSVCTQNEHLSAFWLQTQQAHVEDHFIIGLRKVDRDTLTRFVPVNTNILLTILATHQGPSLVQSLRCLFYMLKAISANAVDAHARNPIVESYVTHVMGLIEGRNDVPLTLLEQYNDLLHESPDDLIHTLYTYSWFLFDVIFKQLALRSDHQAMLGQDDQRGNRCVPQFIVALGALLDHVQAAVRKLVREDVNVAIAFNRNFALFLSDLLSMLNRGAIMDLVQAYVEGLDDVTPKQSILTVLTFDFLHIVCNHEHYTTLNIPTRDAIVDVANLAHEFAQRHFLSGLVLRRVTNALRYDEDSVTRLRAIHLLRNLLLRHNTDTRYNNTLTRARLVGMYFPFVLTLVDMWEEYKLKCTVEEKRNVLLCWLFMVKNGDPELMAEWWQRGTQRRRANYLRLLADCVRVFEYQGRAHTEQVLGSYAALRRNVLQRQYQQAPESTTAADGGDDEGTEDDSEPTSGASPRAEEAPEALRAKDYQMTITRSKGSAIVPEGGLNPEGPLAEEAVDSVNPMSPRDGADAGDAGESRSGGRRLGRRKGRKEQARAEKDAVKQLLASPEGSSMSRRDALRAVRSGMLPIPSSGTGAAASAQPAAAASASAGDMRRNWRARMDSTMRMGESDTAAQKLPEGVHRQEALLGREAARVVLDSTLSFCRYHEGSMRLCGSPYTPLVFAIFDALLSCNQSFVMLTFVAQGLRYLVHTFQDVLFIQPTTYCGDLAFRLLCLCNAQHGRIRQDAASLLYLMMKLNYKLRGNFSRMRLQCTIGVNKTNDPSLGVELNDEWFRESLSSVITFAKSDHSAGLPTSFVDDIADLMQRLFTVLANMIKVRQYAYDPEMMADLYHQICDGYQASPDLRAAWLATLSSLHERNHNYEEAAQCRIHLSALISTYVNLLKPDEAVAVDANGFLLAAPNAAPEFVVPADLAQDEGICQSQTFTRNGLFDELQRAHDLLRQDKLFESAIVVQRLAVSIHQKNRNFAALAECFSSLATMCNHVVLYNESGGRIFSSYYRVGFYGDLAGDQAGKQWVYKERNTVRLSDLTARLRAQYEGHFGANRVHLLPNSEVRPESLSPGCFYLQVVAVKPHFEPEELERRRTAFDRQTNLRTFIFETPFTKDSSQMQGDWGEQYKRKTVVTLGQPFPFVKKRLLIVDQRSIVLTPVENAREGIESRVAAMGLELESPSPSLKMVQNVLQGSVLLQVNPGPLKIAEVFLAPGAPAAADASPDHVEALRQALRDFAHRARQLLLLNKSLIMADQLKYQQVLSEGYNDMLEQFAPYVGKEGLPAPVEVVQVLEDEDE